MTINLQLLGLSAANQRIVSKIFDPHNSDQIETEEQRSDEYQTLHEIKSEFVGSMTSLIRWVGFLAERKNQRCIMDALADAVGLMDDALTDSFSFTEEKEVSFETNLDKSRGYFVGHKSVPPLEKILGHEAARDFLNAARESSNRKFEELV